MTEREGTARLAARPALPAVLRGPALVLAVLGALVAAAGAIFFSTGVRPGPIDAWVETQDPLGQPLRSVALVFDFCGEPVGSVLVVAALLATCLALRRVRTAVLAVLAIGVTVVLTTVLKPVVGRTIHGHYLSFPSGHTAFATSVALVAALLITDRRRLGRSAAVALFVVLSLAAGAAMGWSEVGLGAHFPTDAVGGYCVALAVVPAAAWLVDRITDRADRADRRAGLRS